MIGRFHLLMLYPLPQSHCTASIYHVEVEEGDEVEEEAAEADGGGGPERGQHQADVVDEGQLGGVHSLSRSSSRRRRRKGGVGWQVAV